MSEEEKKEYEELKSLLYTGNLSQAGKRKLIEIVEKQQEQLQEKDKIINMAIELIARKVGSRVEICPDMNCTVEKKKDCKECAIEYFTKKAREV